MNARDHRVSCAPLRTLDPAWRQAARAFASRHGIALSGVLDMFDEVASLYFYEGEHWNSAQARAWPDVCAILTPREVAA